MQKIYKNMHNSYVKRDKEVNRFLTLSRYRECKMEMMSSRLFSFYSGESVDRALAI